LLVGPIPLRGRAFRLLGQDCHHPFQAAVLEEITTVVVLLRHHDQPRSGFHSAAAATGSRASSPLTEAASPGRPNR
jgi:hypothetical protein